MRLIATFIVVMASSGIDMAFAADTTMSESLRDGQSLYAKRCGLCHQERGFGANILARRVGTEKSLLENRRDLDPAYIRVAVRNGIGSMPPFTKVELTDGELQMIANYLTRETR